MAGTFRVVEHEADLCVVGGGMSGYTAALAAANCGVKVLLMHARTGALRGCIVLLIVAWLTLAADVSAADAARGGQAAETKGEKVRILFFGDSICAGSNLPGGGPDDAWPALFAAAHKSDCEIINLSKGGRPTASVLEFKEALVKAGACDAVVLALGANDSRDLSKDMVQKACGNIREMLRLAREAGIQRLILVGAYNINPEKLGATYPIRNERKQNLELLNGAFQKLAQEEKAEFVELYGRLPLDSLTYDGVHPDKAGNILLAKAFEAFWAKSR